MDKDCGLFSLLVPGFCTAWVMCSMLSNVPDQFGQQAHEQSQLCNRSKGITKTAQALAGTKNLGHPRQKLRGTLDPSTTQWRVLLRNKCVELVRSTTEATQNVSPKRTLNTALLFELSGMTTHQCTAACLGLSEVEWTALGCH